MSDFSIEELDLVSETEKFVTILNKSGRTYKEQKSATWHRYFKTRLEAEQVTLERLKLKISQTEILLKSLNEQLIDFLKYAQCLKKDQI